MIRRDKITAVVAAGVKSSRNGHWQGRFETLVFITGESLWLPGNWRETYVNIVILYSRSCR